MKLQFREVTSGLRFPEGPIAMADGTPEARAAARTQTLAADEDGVAAYLESIL